MPDPQKISAFILAGGSGERFWPWSRTHLPKHLLRLFSEKTLLVETLERFTLALPKTTTRILTNHLQIPKISQHCPQIPSQRLIGEPAKRDTAPAAALATAIAIADGGPDQIVILSPADARIQPTEAFITDIRKLADAAATHHGIHTLGIPPTYPATAFGYLQLGMPVDQKTFTLTRFVEKPDLPTAQHFLNSGHFLWNAGIFAWQAQTFLNETKRQQPALAHFIENFPSAPQLQQKYIQDNFPTLPKISVDYAICENAAALYTIKASFQWDDVGTWDALPKHLGTDAHNNTTLGRCLLHDTSGTIAASQGRLIATLGVNDLVIAETPDAILVASRDKIHQLKTLVNNLPENLK
jgi:mannose-1-phosphate guanylyltransferase